MADAVILPALRIIGSAAIQEIATRCGVGNDLQWLERELPFMRACIHDAEAKRHENELVGRWLDDLTQLLRDATRELEDYNKPRSTMSYFVHPFTSKNRRIAKQIKSFKKRLSDLARKRLLYDIHPNSVGTTDRVPIRSNSNRNEEGLIGYEDIVATLRDEVLNGGSSRKVVSIYGMGGLGKTALAKNLYHSDCLKNIFVRAYVQVSANYRTNDLVGMVISSLINYMSNDDLQRLNLIGEGDHKRFLEEFLRTRRYLVVLDDVWDTNVWEFFKGILPDSNNRSRVIITTRKKSVGDRIVRASVYKLRFLNPEESLNLFRTRVNQVTEDMEALGETMVNRCGGLPLAIIMLGEMLNENTDLARWRMVNDAGIWGPLKRYTDRRNYTEISDLLTLSFDNLPRDERRPLFLHLGMFPSGYEIDVNKLCNMWITEPHDNDMRHEWVEEFFKELIDCSLITEEGRFWEEPTTCKVVHDLLRHLIVEKAKDLTYFDIFTSTNYCHNVVVHMPSIRHAIHGRADDYVNSLELLRVRANNNIRTLLFFNTRGCVRARSLAQHCARFRRLEVLDLTGVDFSLAWIPLSDMLRKIKNLKFLVMADNSINMIPRRIRNQRRLHVLDTGTNSLCILPKMIRGLQQLRHLHGFFHDILYLPEVGTLHSARVLSNPLLGIVLETSRMNDLKELSLRCKSTDSIFFISQLKSLSTLIISSCSSPPGEDPSYDQNLPVLDQELSFCEHLSNLWLDGPLVTLPNSEQFPRYMQRLILSRSALRNDPMPTLGMLPNLTSLELMNAYDGECMVCTKNSFQQLIYFRLFEARNLTEWEVEEGAMPRIQGLTISECPQLILPQRFQDFPNAGRTRSVYGFPKYQDYNPPEV